jgi:hypothetical protein
MRMLQMPAAWFHVHTIKTEIFPNGWLTHPAFIGYCWDAEALAVQCSHDGTHLFGVSNAPACFGFVWHGVMGRPAHRIGGLSWLR